MQKAGFPFWLVILLLLSAVRGPVSLAQDSSPVEIGTRLEEIGGKPVRLRFVMKDADLYSLRFR